MKKGTRVEFKLKGKLTYGVVEKGGNNKITVVIDGGEKSVKGSAMFFKPSNHPLATDVPNVMDKYSIKRWKEIEGHGDSRTFDATIYKNGKPILVVNNNGWGGCNCYDRLSITDNTPEQEFRTDCKAWVKQFGYADMIEPEDTWVEWWQFRRPYGVTAQAEIESYKEILKG